MGRPASGHPPDATLNLSFVLAGRSNRLATVRADLPFRLKGFAAAAAVMRGRGPAVGTDQKIQMQVMPAGGAQRLETFLKLDHPHKLFDRGQSILYLIETVFPQ